MQPLPPIPGQKKSPANSWTSSNSIATQRKIARALALREEQRSFSQIGAAMGLSASYAQRLVVRGMREIVREPAERLVEMENLLLDDVIDAVLPLLEATKKVKDANGKEAEVPDAKVRLGAADRTVKTSESRRKLLGLDAATKQDVNMVVTEQIDPKAEQIEAMVRLTAADQVNADHGSN